MNEAKGRNIKKDINLLCHIGEHLVSQKALLDVEIVDPIPPYRVQKALCCPQKCLLLLQP